VGNRGKLVKALQTPVSVLLDDISLNTLTEQSVLGMREGVGACIRIPIALGSYLVDPASSHMLVSKIKPCMSKYKLLIL
jgi:hypothetical protein